MKRTVIIFLLVNTIVCAQGIVPSVTNIFRYGEGKRNIGTLEIPFLYTENLTDVRLKLPGNITTGFRLLYDNPPEIGTKFQGLSRRFIEFHNEGLYLRAGNFSNLYGNGLAMNLFENRRLAYDTWMDGIKGEYSHNYFNASIAAGTISFYDSIIVGRREEYDLRSANIEFKPIKNSIIGFSFIAANGKIPGLSDNITSLKVEIPEFYFSFTFKNFSLLFDYSQKKTNVLSTNEISKGFGYYGAFSFAGDGIGLTLDYKNYQYDIRDPYESDNARATRMLPFQNPPIVMKEHSFTLLTRPLHDIDFNDEVGIQLELFYLLNENTTVTLNGSFTSRHDSFILNESTFAFDRIKRNSNWLPSINQELSPYIELFAEAEYFFGNTNAVRFVFARRLKTFYNYFSPQNNHYLRSTVIPVQVQYSFSHDFSLIIQTENEWVYDSYASGDNKYYNQLLTLSGSFFSKLTIAARGETTTSNDDPAGKKDWIVGEIGYRISSFHSVSLTFGRERGGQVCANGVCTYLQPFSGIRFSLLSAI